MEKVDGGAETVTRRIKIKGTARRLGPTTVRLVRHGEDHPYCIEVTTPGWRGVDHVDGGLKRTMPKDLSQICDTLKNAGVRYYSISEPDREDVILFPADGTAEFVLRDAEAMEAAITALVRAGWLSPPTHPTIQ